MENPNDKAFFGWLRQQQADKHLSQNMVDGANELLALMTHDELKQALTKVMGLATQDNQAQPSTATLQLSAKGIEQINQFEGFKSKPYLDSVGKATIGYGTTYYVNADGSRKAVTLNDTPITQEQAHAIKQAVINHDFAPAVNLMFADEIANGKISQNQFDALISLAYNIGIKGLKGSSVYRNIKNGDFKAAADSFLAWNKGRVNGQLTVLKGLTNRRAKERELFLA